MLTNKIVERSDEKITLQFSMRDTGIGMTAEQRANLFQAFSQADTSTVLPIIAMTAHAMAGDEQKSLEAGMNDHVTKPIDPDQLFATLQKWIKPSEKGIQDQQPEVPVEPPESDKKDWPAILEQKTYRQPR